MHLDSLYLEITKRCNLNCIHCFADGSLFSKELSLKEIFNILDTTAKNKAKKVILSGGEPLLHPRFYKIAAYASQKGLQIHLLTNGTLVDKRAIERFKKINIDTIQISLDGANAKTHDAIRGKKGSFKKAIDAILLCKKQGFNVVVRTIVMKNNVKEIQDIVDFCQHFNITAGISLINPSGKAGKKLYPKLKDYKDCMHKISEPEGLDITSRARGTACGVGYEFIAILFNGDIVPCMPMRNKVMGNIRKDNFTKIFKNHPVMKEIRRSTSNNISECHYCKANKKCLGGCKQRTYELHNTFFAPDNAQCVLFKDPYKIPNNLNRSALCFIE
ncbi:MAG: radical SAM protein [Candidatus Margulisiibacteriota bacterium]|nr:radical SAM protein [Candidatus Margulisiibacteriota bacterium]